MYTKSESGLSDMGELATFAEWTGAAAHELVLFAAVFFLIGGLDDLLVDLVWLVNRWWRRLFVYNRHLRADLTTLAPPEKPGWIAVFIPAWHEADVIGPMLQTALSRFGRGDYTLYVGTYPNDSDTIDIVAAIAQRDARVRLVVNERPGPTTKADCLNALWHMLVRDEALRGRRCKAVVLHDAEDVVHPGELRVFDTLIERFDLVQLPVLPLVHSGSRWISGHYCDEFAELHAKGVIAREAMGAAVPSAGVGCAFARTALERIATSKNGSPFDSESLTEDYELGLRIVEQGGAGIFVRLPVNRGGRPIAIRAHFPASFAEAVHQKSRWMTGIALAGWDRLGWHGGFAEFWMRLRDRRALLAAIVLLAAYAALILLAFSALLRAISNTTAEPLTPAMQILLAANAALLGWRLLMRFLFVARAYGWREGLRAIPRVVIANIIAMMAARVAIGRYLKLRRGGVIEWGKTAHIFPQTVPVD